MMTSFLAFLWVLVAMVNADLAAETLSLHSWTANFVPADSYSAGGGLQPSLGLGTLCLGEIC